MAITVESRTTEITTNFSFLTFTMSWDAALATNDSAVVLTIPTGSVIYIWNVFSQYGVGDTGSTMKIGSTALSDATFFMGVTPWSTAVNFNSFTSGMNSTINYQFTEDSDVTLYAGTVIPPEVTPGWVKGWFMLGNYV